MIIDTKYSIGDVFYAPYCRRIGDAQFEALIAKKVISSIIVAVGLNRVVECRYQVNDEGLHHSLEYFDQLHPQLEQAQIVAAKYQRDEVEYQIKESI